MARRRPPAAKAAAAAAAAANESAASRSYLIFGAVGFAVLIFSMWAVPQEHAEPPQTFTPPKPRTQSQVETCLPGDDWQPWSESKIFAGHPGRFESWSENFAKLASDTGGLLVLPERSMYRVINADATWRDATGSISFGTEPMRRHAAPCVLAVPSAQRDDGSFGDENDVPIALGLRHPEAFERREDIRVQLGTMVPLRRNAYENWSVTFNVEQGFQNVVMLKVPLVDEGAADDIE